MTMSSPAVAMLWENWRLTRVEAAMRVALGVVGGLAVFVLFPALLSPLLSRIAPNEDPRDFGATSALGLIILLDLIVWQSIAKLRGGRFLEGYRPGFPLYLLYTHPLRTATLVGIPMAFQAALGVAVYLVSALVLRVTLDYPLPLLTVAAPMAAVHLGQTGADWSTRSKAVQWIGSIGVVATIGLLAVYRWKGWPTLFDFSRADYALMASIGVAAFGAAVVGVARQRYGSAPPAIPRAPAAGFPEWLVTLLRFPCPTSSATRAQVWFDLKSSGLPVLTIGVALAIVIPLLFAVSGPIDALLSMPYARLAAVSVAMLSVLTVLILGGNAFGIRARQGRTSASVFDATQAYGTARTAGLKVLVRSVCVLAALVAVGASAWTSLSVIPFDDGKPLIEIAKIPLSRWMRAIEGAVGTMSAYEQLALAFVTFIAVAVMVAWRAADAALRARYQRRQRIAGSLLLLYALALVLLALAGERGIGPEIPLGAILEATKWIVTAAIVLATVYLFWSVLAERVLTLRQASSAVLIAVAFGAAWVTVLRAGGVQLSGMPTMDAAWMLSPALLPLMLSVLAPWSLSRVRHT